MSKVLMRHDEVSIGEAWRPIIGAHLRDRLFVHGVFVLCLSMSAQHSHILGKVNPEVDPRQAMGKAKMNSNFELKSWGWTGKLWAVRGKEKPIADRSHQINVYNYILRHEEEGAWVWKWTPGFVVPATSFSPNGENVAGSPADAVRGLDGNT